MPTAMVDGTELYYEESGSGPPIVNDGPKRKGQGDFVVSLTDSRLAKNEWAAIMLG